MKHSIEHLSRAFSDCLLEDDNSPSEIYDCLMNVILEEETYFQRQLKRVQDLKQMLENSQALNKTQEMIENSIRRNIL
jgi:hypothetical protein